MAPPVNSDHPTADGRARVFLRPLGNPQPLGFVALAMSASVLSSLQLGWIPVAEQHQAALVLMAFACPLQAIATVLLFLARDAPMGAGIGVLSFSWLTYGLLLLTSPPGSRSAVAAIFLFTAGAALLPAVASAAVAKLVPAAVLLVAAAKLVLTGVFEKVGGAGWEHAAGWEGVVLAAMALYGALASDLESEMSRTVLPVGRWGRGRRAVVQSVADQAATLQVEPGVRTQT